MLSIATDTPRALQKGEVLVEISKLEQIFRKSVPQATLNEFKARCDAMNNVALSTTERHRNFNELIDLIKKEVVKGDDIYTVLGMEITQDYESTLKQDKSNSFTIVGVYYGVDGDVLPNGFPPIVLCESDLEEMEVYTGQGIYSRIIAPTQSRGAKKVASIMTSKEGLSLYWFRNDMMDYINERSDWVQDFFQIFIYVAIVLALFSMFMLFNYISSTIVSKRQSIGVFRALGSNVKDVSIMFIVESVIIAVVNAILACIVTAVACIFVNKYIMDQLCPASAALPTSLWAVAMPARRRSTSSSATARRRALRRNRPERSSFLPKNRRLKSILNPPPFPKAAPALRGTRSLNRRPPLPAPRRRTGTSAALTTCVRTEERPQRSAYIRAASPPVTGERSWNC